MKKLFAVEMAILFPVFMLLYTGFNKLMNFDAFVLSMRFQHLPEWMTTILIYTLPEIEIVVAGMLLVPVLRRAGILIFVLLISLFTLYAGTVWLGIFPVAPCPCGGLISSLSWGQHFWFNTGFTILGIIALYLDVNSREAQNISRAKSG